MEKLVRNLRKGDKIVIHDETHKATITVAAVQEIQRGHFTGKRTWAVSADYPWWWGITPITGYHNSKIKLAS